MNIFLQQSDCQVFRFIASPPTKVAWPLAGIGIVKIPVGNPEILAVESVPLQSSGSFLSLEVCGFAEIFQRIGVAVAIKKSLSGSLGHFVPRSFVWIESIVLPKRRNYGIIPAQIGFREISGRVHSPSGKRFIWIHDQFFGLGHLDTAEPAALTTGAGIMTS